MNLSKELIEKIYENYIQRYPSYKAYKDFFYNIIEKDETLYKSWCYTYLPAEEFDLRTELKKEIGDDADVYIYDKFYERYKKGKGGMLFSLYNDYHLVEAADRLFPIQHTVFLTYQVNPPLTYTIEEIRKILGRVERRQYTEGKKNIEEKKIFLYFPHLIQIERKIKDDKKTEMQTEFEYLEHPFFEPPNFNFEKLCWEKFTITDILQKDNDIDVVWNINPTVEYSMVFSYKGKKEKLPFNLLERYYPLIVSVFKKYKGKNYIYKYQPLKEAPNDVNLGLGKYTPFERHEFFGVTLTAVLNLAKKYRGPEGFFPGYLDVGLKSQVRDERKKLTTMIKDQRILKADLEFSGGSLNEPIGEEGIERIDLIPAKNNDGWEATRDAEDAFIAELDFVNLKKELIDFLFDQKDKVIFEKYFLDHDTQIQIAEDLSITQQAVQKRIEKIEKYFEKNLEKFVKPKK